MSKVFLIGAGPGAADLLTLRAARLLESADVVLFDALVSADVLLLTRSTARLINVGKRCGRKALDQEEINALLVHEAKSSEVVVRLKGGDPLVFGRAAEEMKALRSAGIEFEIVPGVTAACSAAAAAKISLTDRHCSSELVLTTAQHSQENSSRRLADSVRPESTLVIYMPGRDYGHIREELLAGGLAGDTPCVVVTKISSPDQEVFATDLRSLDQMPSVPSPSVLIVGEVARQEFRTAVRPFESIAGQPELLAVGWSS